MKTFRYPFTSLLAVLQQAEYDPHLFQQWCNSFHVLTPENISALHPERWTTKLKLIKLLGRVFSLTLPHRYAILLALKLIEPFEGIARTVLMWQARQKLRHLQSKGLTVVAIAGSFGKTSTKHLLTHILSGSMHVAASPGSFNTPLGLASSIRNLTSKHDIFLAELGEYQQGDIATLLEFLQPDIGVLTPVGYAHQERFGSEQALKDTFAELWTSPHAPEMLLVDDDNRGRLSPPEHAYWYGSLKESHLTLKVRDTSFEETSGTLTFSDGTTLPFHLGLPGKSLARNTLPGILLLQLLQKPIDVAVQALRVLQPISRRLELHHNPNGSIFVDNSYNTNPSAWKHSFSLLQSFKGKVGVFTAGFVELDTETSHLEHMQMARDLLDLDGALIGVVRTRGNQDLIDELTKHLTPEKLLIGFSYDELLTQASERGIRFDLLWIEGGVRELYQ